MERAPLRFAFECPRGWESLAPTTDAAVRHCDDCDQPVYLSADDREARAHTGRGRCVAVPVAAASDRGAPMPMKTGLLLMIPAPGPPPAVAWVVPLDGPRAGETFRLLDGVTKIGRAPDNHLVLELNGVSAWHAEIKLEPSGYVVRDLGTCNGTYLNDRRIMRVELVDGDVIALAKYRLLFKTVLGPDGLAR